MPCVPMLLAIRQRVALRASATRRTERVANLRDHAQRDAHAHAHAKVAPSVAHVLAVHAVACRAHQLRPVALRRVDLTLQLGQQLGEVGEQRLRSTRLISAAAVVARLTDKAAQAEEGSSTDTNQRGEDARV